MYKSKPNEEGTVKPNYPYPSRAVFQEFQSTFGVKLSEYFNGLFGFEIVAFDKYIGTPDGTSLKDYLTEKYGVKACQLVESLI